MNTQTVVDLTESLGWIINQEKFELKPTQVFSFMRYKYVVDSVLIKPTQERWLNLQDLILHLKSKHVLTARCLLFLIGLLNSMEKMVLPQGTLEISSVIDNLLPWSETISAHLEWWQNPANVMKGAHLHPKDHSIQIFTDISNEGWGAHLNQVSNQRSVVRHGKRLHINVLELKAVSPQKGSRTSAKTKRCWLLQTTQQ